MSEEIFAAPYHKTLGSLFVATIAPGALWGAVCVQLYYYVTNFPNDSKWLKGFVWLLFCLDSVHQILIFRYMYIIVINMFGQADKLGSALGYKSLWDGLPVHGSVIVLVEFFYVYRIWRISGRNMPLTAIIGSLVLGDCIFFAVTSGYFLSFTSFEEEERIKPKLFPPLIVLTAVADLAIAGALGWYLRAGRTGRHELTVMLNKMIVYTVGTGLLTSIFMFAMLIAYYLSPKTFIYQIFFNTGSRLYVNSMMFSLNMRGKHEKDLANTTTAATSTGYSTYPSRGKAKLQPITFIRKQTETHGTTTIGDSTLDWVTKSEAKPTDLEERSFDDRFTRPGHIDEGQEPPSSIPLFSITHKKGVPV